MFHSFQRVLLLLLVSLAASGASKNGFLSDGATIPKAYGFSTLSAKGSGVFQDQFGGQLVNVHWDEASRTA